MNTISLPNHKYTTKIGSYIINVIKTENGVDSTTELSVNSFKELVEYVSKFIASIKNASDGSFLDPFKKMDCIHEKIAFGELLESVMSISLSSISDDIVAAELDGKLVVFNDFAPLVAKAIHVNQATDWRYLIEENTNKPCTHIAGEDENEQQAPVILH